MKRLIRGLLRRLGYVIRPLNPGESDIGISPYADVRTHLGNPRRPLLFDVGGNQGQTIDDMRAVFDDPHIISFEPSPTTGANLESTHGQFAKIERLALGATPGRLPFYVTAHSVYDSLKPPLGMDYEEKAVEVMTIDDYCRQSGLNRIDLLKIDAQGADLDVLRGAERMFRECRVKALAVELPFVATYAKENTFLEILNHCDSLDFIPLGFYNQSYQDGKFTFCDVVLVPKS